MRIKKRMHSFHYLSAQEAIVYSEIIQPILQENVMPAMDHENKKENFGSTEKKIYCGEERMEKLSAED
jgi:hypothetical protein